MPTNLIYNKTARVMRREESKLARIADPFQAKAARNFPRIRIGEIGLASAKTNKQRQKCDAPEVVK